MIFYKSIFFVYFSLVFDMLRIKITLNLFFEFETLKINLEINMHSNIFSFILINFNLTK